MGGISGRVINRLAWVRAALVLAAIILSGAPGFAASPTVSFDVEFGGWDGTRHHARLAGGSVVLGWPRTTVSVTPRLPRGWTAEPRFAAQHRGASWRLRTPDARESVPLPFRLRGPRGQHFETNLVLLLPLRFAADSGGYVQGPGFRFPLGAYPRDVPARFRERAAAWTNRLYVIRDTGAAISPHFTLGMFVSKTRPGRMRTAGVHLLALDYALVSALERVQEAWSRGGRPGLVRVESPFRTPDYNNAAEAGRATFSQHLYGSAVDILISSDTDRLHDDIDGDGDRDQADILPLARLVKKLMGERRIPRGGIGVYEYIYRDGRPGELTVHLDIRGYITTWGQLYDSDTVRPAGTIAWE